MLRSLAIRSTLLLALLLSALPSAAVTPARVILSNPGPYHIGDEIGPSFCEPSELSGTILTMPFLLAEMPDGIRLTFEASDVQWPDSIWVNGQFVGEVELCAGGCNDFNSHNDLNLLPYVIEGENTLVIGTSNGDDIWLKDFLMTVALPGTPFNLGDERSPSFCDPPDPIGTSLTLLFDLGPAGASVRLLFDASDVQWPDSVWVNGSFVGEIELCAGGCNDFNSHNNLDLTPYVTGGNNTLTFGTSNGDDIWLKDIELVYQPMSLEPTSWGCVKALYR